MKECRYKKAQRHQDAIEIAGKLNSKGYNCKILIIHEMYRVYYW